MYKHRPSASQASLACIQPSISSFYTTWKAFRKRTLTYNNTTYILNPSSRSPSLQTPNQELTKMWDYCCISIKYLVPLLINYFKARDEPIFSITLYHAWSSSTCISTSYVTCVTANNRTPPISPSSLRTLSLFIRFCLFQPFRGAAGSN